jgi:hypothetical protein
LKENPHNEFNKDASPKQFITGKWTLNAHPDVGMYLWTDFTVLLPVECQWVLFGNPVLVRPDTGIIFGIAEGTHPPLLRLNEKDKVGALQEGGKQKLYNLSGIFADADDIGIEWIYCSVFSAEAKQQYGYNSFLYAR